MDLWSSMFCDYSPTGAAASLSPPGKQADSTNRKRKEKRGGPEFDSYLPTYLLPIVNLFVLRLVYLYLGHVRWKD